MSEEPASTEFKDSVEVNNQSSQLSSTNSKVKVKERKVRLEPEQTGLEKSLQAMQDTLDDIKAVVLLTRSADIEAAKKKILKEGSEEKRVYELCDSKTTEEIVALTGKTSGNIRGVISTLRQKGLVKTVEKEGKKVHQQRF